MNKYAFIILALLAIAAAIFEFHPAVEYHRIVVSEDIYVGKPCDCWCILESRPWFSKINYWFWFWFIIIPVFVFSVTPLSSKWFRMGRTVFAIGLGYILMNLAVHLMWDIRNGPFAVVSDYPWQTSWDDPGVKCADIADGGSLVFTALFGWIPSGIYYSLWDIAWHQYHKRWTKLIDKNFKQGWFNRIVTYSFLSIFIIVFCYIASNILYYNVLDL